MAKRSRRPCLTCKGLIRRGSYCETCDPNRHGARWTMISRTLRTEHRNTFGLVCPGLPELDHAEHAVADFSDLTVDHIVGLAYGGTDDRSNLRILCRSANSSRSRET